VDPALRLDTPRLRLRPLAPRDLGVIVRIHTDPALMRHIHRGVPHTADECVVDLARALAHWRDHRCGSFVVTTRAGRLVGTVGFTTPEWLPEVMPGRDVGWTIVQEHQGHGYATEAARTALDWYFATMRDDRGVGIHNSDNPRSGAVMQRLGMRWSRRTPHPTLGYPLEIWETTRAEWCAD
jgi:RimJ/RimL family protein N-acetyltransferase